VNDNDIYQQELMQLGEQVLRNRIVARRMRYIDREIVRLVHMSPPLTTVMAILEKVKHGNMPEITREDLMREVLGKRRR
jgi:hypothetical protein